MDEKADVKKKTPRQKKQKTKMGVKKSLDRISDVNESLEVSPRKLTLDDVVA